MDVLAAAVEAEEDTEAGIGTTQERTNQTSRTNRHSLVCKPIRETGRVKDNTRQKRDVTLQDCKIQTRTIIGDEL